MSLNFKTIYFALVSLVAVLVLAFSLTELVQDVILISFPEIAQHDLAQLETSEGDGASASPGEDYGRNWRKSSILPLWSDIIKNIVQVLIFGALLAWHLPRLLRREK